MKRLEILYPFTSGVIGVDEEHIAAVHDNSLIHTARMLQEEGWLCSIHYLTKRGRGYSVRYKGLPYYFHPVSNITTKYIGRPHLHRDPFGTEWSHSLLKHVLTSNSNVSIFFIGSGWFAKFLALIHYLRQKPYMVIVAGRGIPRGRSQKWYLEKSTGILVHTRRHRQWLYEERGISLGKIKVFPIGVDTSRFRPQAYPRERDRRTPHLLYVGRLVPNKGLYEALQAFVQIREAFPAARMTVVGPWGSTSFRNKIERFMQENEVTSLVSFAGPVANEHLPRFYQEADLLLFPSQSESFGIVIVESMACGTPVVAIKNSGGPDEIISHEKDGLLVDPEEIGKAALSLLRNREQLRQMGQTARRKIEAQYSLEQTYQQLQRILAEII